jgi:hypothetical protein
VRAVATIVAPFDPSWKRRSPRSDGRCSYSRSPVDNTVGIENAVRLYQSARYPKSFVSLDDADHLLGRERDSLYGGSALAGWVEPGARSGAADGRGAARRQCCHGQDVSGAFRTDIRLGAHSILADEPTAVGGENLGPTPYDLLASALCACTTMTCGCMPSARSGHWRRRW